MKLTEEQIQTLSQWEDNFRTAVCSSWTRNPGRAGLQVIHQIYTQVTGDTRRLNTNCNHCILSLVKDCGRLYFQDKEELIAAKNAEVFVEKTKAEAEPVTKVAIKTSKKGKTTTKTKK